MRMSRTVNIVALAATCGYDGLYVDLQHSSIDLDMAAQIFQAGLLSDVTVFARVPSLEPGTIGRVMDAGAMGILAPDIRSGDDARLLVKAALIAPKGERSVGSGIPNPRFRDVPAAALADRINAATLLIAMIETPEGVAAAEEIAAVEGIDAVEIGSNDLTTAMGIPNQYDHERLREAYRHVIAACRKHGKPMIAGGIRGRKLLEVLHRDGRLALLLRRHRHGLHAAGRAGRARRRPGCRRRRGRLRTSLRRDRAGRFCPEETSDLADNELACPPADPNPRSVQGKGAARQLRHPCPHLRGALPVLAQARLHAARCALRGVPAPAGRARRDARRADPAKRLWHRQRRHARCGRARSLEHARGRGGRRRNHGRAAPGARCGRRARRSREPRGQGRHAVQFLRRRGALREPDRADGLAYRVPRPRARVPRARRARPHAGRCRGRPLRLYARGDRRRSSGLPGVPESGRGRPDLGQAHGALPHHRMRGHSL